MSSHLGYLLLGLGAGSAIAALGLGLVMVYRASGVINLAQGALGMFIALAFFTFRESGRVTLPLLGLPSSFHLIDRPTLATALAVFIPYGLVLGALVYLLVFRPLRRSPPLAQVVASVGLFLYLWAVAELRFPGEVLIRTIVDDTGRNVLGRLVTSDQFYIAGMVLVGAGVLWWVGAHSRFGLATTAAAENERGAILAGLRPELLALGNWSLAVCLAGTFTILAAQLTRLDPLTTSLAVVPALAAALLGGFRSYGAVVIGGLVLGMGASELTNLQADYTWVPKVGWQQGLPLLVILGVMLLRGRPLPERGALAAAKFPAAPKPRHAVASTFVVVPVIAAAMLVIGPDLRSGLITSAVAAVISLSVVVLTGWVGQISLAPLAFAGVAGFSLVRLAEAGLGVLAPVLAVLVATAVGVLVGLPAVRVRGMSLAIATLAAAIAIEELLFKWSWFTGGVEGVRAPKLSLFGADLSISAPGAEFPRPVFGVVCVVVCGAVALGVAQLLRSRLGVAFLAVRGNERAAAGAGVDVARVKLLAFAISAALAGVGGVLLAYQRQSLSVQSYQVFASLSVVALTYLAGITSISGALVAGALAPEGLIAALSGSTSSSTTQFAINGLALIVVAIVAPEGVTGVVRRRVRGLADRRSAVPTQIRQSPSPQVGS
ncbi:MAG: ABC transporter permease [Microthrixaceae bacterium]|nr:ABC transporter permease [Microthrixaceae bacterium]